MKKSVILLLIMFSISSSVYSCGTVEGWYKYYFEHKGNEHQQLYALTLIQCEPILIDQYKHSFAQDTMLFNIIEDAFQKGVEYGNDCFTANAIKIFILFDELKTLAVNKDFSSRYNILKLRIDNFINLPIQGLSYLKLSYYNFSGEEEYCEQVKNELRLKK